MTTNLSDLSVVRLAYARSRLEDELGASRVWSKEARPLEALVAVAALLDSPEADAMPADLRRELVDAVAEPFSDRVDFPQD